MKQFWEDYWELCKETGHFYKKHWKGVVVLNAGHCRSRTCVFRIPEQAV